MNFSFTSRASPTTALIDTLKLDFPDIQHSTTSFPPDHYTIQPVHTWQTDLLSPWLAYRI